ncbi:hypothetical protein NFI96_004031 [Prochilodus magdalenae]|nr:hypothetical protein NFI96_004031 [Prochilodus magdalenae]
MGKSKEISQDIRKRIVDLHKSGSSLGAISRCLKVPRSSVQTIIRKYKKDGNVQPSYRSGRKKVLCPRDERALVRSVHINPRAKAKDLVNMMAEAGTVKMNPWKGLMSQQNGRAVQSEYSRLIRMQNLTTKERRNLLILIGIHASLNFNKIPSPCTGHTAPQHDGTTTKFYFVSLSIPFSFSLT